MLQTQRWVEYCVLHIDTSHFPIIVTPKANLPSFQKKQSEMKLSLSLVTRESYDFVNSFQLALGSLSAAEHLLKTEL